MFPVAETLHDHPAPRAARVRVALLAALLIAELAALMLRFDTESLRAAGQGWWADQLWRWKFVLPPLAIVIATVAVAFGGARLRRELELASTERSTTHRPFAFLLAHLVGFVLFVRLTAFILEGGFATSPVRGAWIALWLGTAVATATCGALVACPPGVLAAVARRSRAVVVTAVAVGVAAWSAGLVTEAWWDPLRAWTMSAVSAMVRLIASDAFVDAPNFVVGTHRFSVRLLSACAGYEGIGLMLVFVAAYLWTFRRSLRFPHVLLLVPLGVLVVWLANAVRLAVLIAIGTWISPAIAFGGFHTYSGSLVFSAAALSLVFVTQRSRVFTRAPSATQRTVHDEDAAPYLLPFLAVVAATMLTGALSAGGFDATYPIRVLAAGGVLWLFRDRYRALRWNPSWTAAAYGAGAFAVWMALEPPADASAAELGAGFTALPAAAAAVWLAFRVAGSVLVVPIAEELAFRGYLLRRLATVEVRGLSRRQLSALAIVGSSLLFGIMHSRLVAGTLAGMLFALAYRRRGELADAIVAHAAANACVAVYVLAFGAWGLWA